MKFGAQVTVYRNTWDSVREVAELLDQGPWDSIWYADHYLPPPGIKEEEHLAAQEAFTVAAATASITTNLKIGHLVLGNTYRNPGLVAKMAGTLDHISHGRFVLGIGAAWFKREHEAYGWDFPSMKERQDRFQEACELIRMMFTADGPVDYRGEYYRLDRAPLEPGCYQQPHTPIMVGGTGERRTLRTLAMYGDVFNLDGWARQGMSMDVYRHKTGVLEKHCEDVGRDPAEIRRTLLMPLQITEDEAATERFLKALGPGSMSGPKSYLIDRIGEFRDAGVDEIMFGFIRTGDIEKYQQVEEEIVAAFD